MKLSIAWIFDHINADYTQLDIGQLVQKFNLTTAEIEYVEKVSYDVTNFTLAQVSQINQDAVVLHSRELGTDIELPLRDDCIENYFYMLVKENGDWRWARMKDWKSSKDGLLPAFSCTGPQCAGSWKDLFTGDDYILHVDNKSITNRPDLWSHRGFAREFAAILDVPMVEEKNIYASRRVNTHERKSGTTTGNPFSFELQDPEYCKRFAALYVANIGHYASWLWMAQKLCIVDAKPIDAFVDTTNYVMLDIGQPLHAFDAEKINSDFIVPRLAYQGEKLQLLDGQTVELTDQDIVITNGQQPIALGGVMGGKGTAVNPETRSILIEAANFDAPTVRRTAQRFKLRTDASSRFEKTVDPNLNVFGLLRFLKILEENNVPLIAASDIVSLGKETHPKTIEITHAHLEQALGVRLTHEFVTKTLEKLNFLVEASQNEEYLYRITVPTLRCTKDIQIPEDIIEEVGRFYGYSNIPHELPKLELKPHSLHNVQRLRQIRQFMSGSLQAREVYNYAFYDEEFLQELKWEPLETVTLANPVSQNWRRLVTSLVPHLLRSVVHADTHQEELRFFEWNRIWEPGEVEADEQKSLAGVIYHKKESIDFYWAKDQLERFFAALGLTVTWSKFSGAQPWYHPYKTATLLYENNIIGYAGIANPAFLQNILEGHAFIFELNGDVLISSMHEQKPFKIPSKYQDSWFDVSMFVPVQTTVERIQKLIKDVDERIISVDLVDFFEKEEWKDKRSIAMRIIIQDPEKTLVTEEIDTVYNNVLSALQKYGATIR